MSGADVVILVTEPTPFGLHDLKIAVTVARATGKPIGIVVNRARDDFQPLNAYLMQQELKVLASIPEDKQVAEVYSTGRLILEVIPRYRAYFDDMATGIAELIGRPGKTQEKDV
jgi:MinD superfamily P-loop ATPase